MSDSSPQPGKIRVYLEQFIPPIGRSLAVRIKSEFYQEIVVKGYAVVQYLVPGDPKGWCDLYINDQLESGTREQLHHPHGSHSRNDKPALSGTIVRDIDFKIELEKDEEVSIQAILGSNGNGKPEGGWLFVSYKRYEQAI